MLTFHPIKVEIYGGMNMAVGKIKRKVDRGAMIVEVASGGPADKAGLRGGDRQLQVGNLLFTIGGVLSPKWINIGSIIPRI